MPVSSLYASIAAFFLVILSTLVILGRLKTGILSGSGGQKHLESAIRAQGNYIEYTPIFLILLLLAEYGQTSDIVLHSMGITYFIGRLIHGCVFHLSMMPCAFFFRVLSVGLTVIPIVSLAVLCILLSIGK